MAFEFDLEAKVDLVTAGTFQIKIKNDGSVAFSVIGAPDGDHHFEWTFDDLQRVSAANRPLIETFLALQGGLRN